MNNAHRAPVIARMVQLGLTQDSSWFFGLDEEEWQETVSCLFGALVWAD